MFARKRGAAEATQQQERGISKSECRASTGGAARRKGLLAAAVSIAAVVGVMAVPGMASAQATRCGAVVKKLVAYPRAEFYKAKVFTNGQVPCGQARRIIWRAIQPGGYDGGIAGWQCQSKGNYDPLAEKCARQVGGVRRVAKSSKPRYCRRCHRNVKRALLMATGSSARERGAVGWRHCGSVHYWRDQYPLIEAKQVGCGLARKVAHGLFADIVHHRHECPGGVCQVRGFTCDPFAKAPPGVEDCVKGREIVRIRKPARKR